MKPVWLVPMLAIVLLLTPGCAVWRMIIGPRTEAETATAEAPPPPPVTASPSSQPPLARTTDRADLVGPPAPPRERVNEETPADLPSTPKPPPAPLAERPAQDPLVASSASRENRSVVDADLTDPEVPPAEAEAAESPEPTTEVAASDSPPSVAALSPENARIPSMSEPPPRPPSPIRMEMPVPVFPEGFDWNLAIDGWVEVEVTVTKDGSVADVVVLASSAPELELPIVEALFEARYTIPRDEAGKPSRTVLKERIEL